jgi:hypothetical protein
MYFLDWRQYTQTISFTCVSLFCNHFTCFLFYLPFAHIICFLILPLILLALCSISMSLVLVYSLILFTFTIITFFGDVFIFFIHLFTCAYIVSVISPPCPLSSEFSLPFFFFFCHFAFFGYWFYSSWF